jgi:SAM-dependent methyltransferase
MTTSTTSSADPIVALKEQHRKVWASGDYGAIAEHIDETPPAAVVAAAGVRPGDRVLDVATGTGNAALRAAQAGARVTGIDLVPELVAVGRERAEANGLAVAWDVGDAERLPYEDASFDRVLSVFGIQFAPRHQVVADELVRVCRPGGTIALVNWTPGGLIGRLLKLVGSYLPKPPEFASPPPLWGDEAHVRRLFDGHDADVTVTHGTNPFRFPSADAFLELFEERYGPVLTARGRLEGEGTWERCRAEIRELLASADVDTGSGYEALSEFLVVRVDRRG